MSLQKSITVRKQESVAKVSRGQSGSPQDSEERGKQQLVKLDNLESDAASGLLLLSVCNLQ